MKIKTILLASIALLAFAIQSKAQNSAFELRYAMPGAYFENERIVPATSGGYAALGYKENTGGSVRNGDCVVTRYTADGNVRWCKTFGTDSLDSPTDIKPTADGGFVVCGYTYNTNAIGEADGFVVKLDSLGALEWANQFGGPTYEEFLAIGVLANNGGYMIAGLRDVGASTFAQALRIDLSGDEVWNQTFTKSSNNVFNGVVPTNDGGAIFTGYSAPNFNFDAVACKVAADGTLAWFNQYNRPGVQLGIHASPTADGGFVMCGFGTSANSANGTDGWVMKCGPNGAYQWGNSYGTLLYERSRCITELPSGQFALTGFVERNPGGSNLMRGITNTVLSSTGAVLWSNSYNTPTVAGEPKGIALSPSGGFVVSGFEFDTTARTYYAMLMHTPANGNMNNNLCTQDPIGTAANALTVTLVTGATVTSASVTSGFYYVTNDQALTLNRSVVCEVTGLEEAASTEIHQIAPNPTSDFITVALVQDLTDAQVTLTDLTGKVLKSWTLGQFQSSTRIDMSDAAAGMYILQVSAKEGQYHGKVVKE